MSNPGTIVQAISPTIMKRTFLTKSIVKLILASKSPYRRQQLEGLGFSFEVDAADVDESRLPDESGRELTIRLARIKADTVAVRKPGCIVIGSDQVGVCKGEILTKPGNRKRALDYLMQYPGNTVNFETAVAVRSVEGTVLTDVVTTSIRFREFSSAEAERYIDLDEPYDCAGAIKSERHASLLFDWVRSDDPSALVGLPLIRTSDFLRRVGVNPLDRD